jgi:hypothetical protein
VAGPIKCECSRCNCSNATSEGVCYECTRGLHATGQWKGGDQVRELTEFKNIDAAYADDLLPVIVPREFKDAFTDPKFCEWFRKMCKHWYKLGLEDGGDSA